MLSSASDAEFSYEFLSTKRPDSFIDSKEISISQIFLILKHNAKFTNKSFEADCSFFLLSLQLGVDLLQQIDLEPVFK